MKPQALPLGEQVPTADQRIIMYGLSWPKFEAQLALRGDVAGPRISYLNGALELMSPSRDHERLKSLVGRLLEVYALERGIEMSPYGAWTLKNRPKEAGAEPDECYIVGDQNKRRPDLAIEVIWTSGGLDKLEIYRRLGVGEVWVWCKGRLEIHVLREGAFVRAERSALFPGLDIELLASFLDEPTATQAMRAYRDALRKKRAPRRSRARRR